MIPGSARTALHTDLEIHKVAEELLGLSLDLVRNIPRDLKQVVGAKIRDECLQVLVLIGRAEDLPPAPPKVKGPSDIIRHYFRQGMRDRLAALTAELGETKDRTTIWRLIAHAHSLGAERSASMLEIKRHGIDIPQNVARKLRQAGFAEALQMNAEDDCDND